MAEPSTQRCAIYTRKSSENGLEQSFNSLHAQREACEAYIKSQAHEGWTLRPTDYDDGGISGGHMERPGLHALIQDIRAQLIDVVVVYKVDRLSRSLADFAQMMQLFDEHDVSFVSVTQHFNTSTSMGRLTLNVLLSFAQFEREVCSERIRDKIAASKARGMWMGGTVPLGYDLNEKQLVINQVEAKQVRHIFSRYLQHGCVRKLKEELDREGYVSKARRNGTGSKKMSRGALYTLLKNPIYIGKLKHKDTIHEGQHQPILDRELWDQVQSQLKRNRIKTKNRTNAKAPSLLAGLLLDSNDNPMSATHTKKNGRRYRYYVSQALLKFETDQVGDVQRIPAMEVEASVLAQLYQLLTSELKLLESIGLDTSTIEQRRKAIRAGNALTSKLNNSNAQQLIPLINEILDRVKLNENELAVSLNPTALLHSLDPSLDNTNLPVKPIELRAPIAIRRSGPETRMIIGEKYQAREYSRSLQAIRKAVCDALRWSDALLSGRATNLTELARQEGTSQRYISSLIALANLDSRIIEEITNGRIPDDLTLERLKRPLPYKWEDQRVQLRFC